MKEIRDTSILERFGGLVQILETDTLGQIQGQIQDMQITLVQILDIQMQVTLVEILDIHIQITLVENLDIHMQVTLVEILDRTHILEI